MWEAQKAHENVSRREGGREWKRPDQRTGEKQKERCQRKMSLIESSSASSVTCKAGRSTDMTRRTANGWAGEAAPHQIREATTPPCYLPSPCLTTPLFAPHHIAAGFCFEAMRGDRRAWTSALRDELRLLQFSSERASVSRNKYKSSLPANTKRASVTLFPKKPSVVSAPYSLSR